MKIENMTLAKISSYGFPSESNMLIWGENLTVLRILKKSFEKKIQCIYLDPPYNTCHSFERFDDTFSQRTWKKFMKERLLVLWQLLSDSGTVWISIDDYEYANLKILCDHLWGVNSYVTTIVREKNKYPSSPERSIVHMHDYILVYAKDLRQAKLKPTKIEDNSSFQYDKDNKMYWRPENLLIKESSLPVTEQKDTHIYEIDGGGKVKLLPPKGRCWRVTKEEFEKLRANNLIWFGSDGIFPCVKVEVKKHDYMRPQTLWTKTMASSNQDARKEIVKYDKSGRFYVPKPEKLLKMILEIATDPGDYVLDAFLGSGTTAAVAHKMHRRWIGIEKEDYQCNKLCYPRLADVVDGSETHAPYTDDEWCGGGGFSYYKLSEKP